MTENSTTNVYFVFIDRLLSFVSEQKKVRVMTVFKVFFLPVLLAILFFFKTMDCLWIRHISLPPAPGRETPPQAVS